jgi:hypothetical protein
MSSMNDKKNQKNLRISVAMTEEIREKAKTLAAQRGLSMSAWIRQQILKGYEENGRV